MPARRPPRCRSLSTAHNAAASLSVPLPVAGPEVRPTTLCSVCGRPPRARFGRIVEAAVRCEQGWEGCVAPGEQPLPEAPRPLSEVRSAIVASVASGRATSREVAEHLEMSVPAAQRNLVALVESGHLLSATCMGTYCYWLEGTASPVARVRAAVRERFASSVQVRQGSRPQLLPPLSGAALGERQADLFIADSKRASRRRGANTRKSGLKH